MSEEKTYSDTNIIIRITLYAFVLVLREGGNREGDEGDGEREEFHRVMLGCCGWAWEGVDSRFVEVEMFRWVNR
jgi:hypothetical protein